MRFGLKRKTESADAAPTAAPQQSQTTQVPQAAPAQPAEQAAPAEQAQRSSTTEAPAPTSTQKEQTVTEQDKAPAETAQKTAEKPADKPAPQAAAKPAGKAPADEKPKKDTGAKLAAGANALRSRIANIVWLIAVVCALILAIGALLVALKMNQDNAIVAFVVDTARALDFGTFKEFTGKNAGIKSALVNWGIAAVIYLVVGKILDRLIRP